MARSYVEDVIKYPRLVSFVGETSERIACLIRDLLTF